jgi:hypothetical protein
MVAQSSYYAVSFASMVFLKPRLPQDVSFGGRPRIEFSAQNPTSCEIFAEQCQPLFCVAVTPNRNLGVVNARHVDSNVTNSNQVGAQSGALRQNAVLTSYSLRCTNGARICQYERTVAVPTSTSSGDHNSDVVWPESMEIACQNWKTSGEPPFPHLALRTSPSWHQFDLRELRYLHYHATVASILQLSGIYSYCHWWAKFSR